MLINVAESEEQNVSTELLEELNSSVLRPFFNALKSGNVERIRYYLAGKKHEQSQFLLNDDKEYQAFLREYYRDAIFNVVQATSSDGLVVVDVTIEFPGRGRKLTQFYVQDQQQNSGSQGATAVERRWRITEQHNNRKR